MDLNQVTVFVSVVETGSFSAAAKQLSLPVSTVSNRVSRLETQLGVTLLRRTTRRLSLTEAGQRYYQLASGGITQLMDAASAVKQGAGEPAGLLRITTPIDLGDCLLASLVNQLYQDYPAVCLDVHIMSRHADLVSEGYDAAIRVGQLKDSSLIARKLASAAWGLFASPAYLDLYPAPQTPEELPGHRFFQFSPHYPSNWGLRKLSGNDEKYFSNSLSVNDIGLLLHMTLSGAGISLLPLYQCRQALSKGALVRLLPEWDSRRDTISLVYPRQRYLPPQLKAFIETSLIVFKHAFD